MDGKHTENEGSEPEDERQEGKSLSRAPLAAVVASAKREASPVPCRATIDAVEVADEETEDSSPASSEDYAIH